GIKDRGKRLDGIIDLLNNYYGLDMHAADDLADIMVTKPCAACHGARLRPESLSVRVAQRTISEIVAWPVAESLKFFGDLKLRDRDEIIAGRIVREIRDRLAFLDAVGLNYLSL